MASRELADMTWEEVRDLDRARTIAVLPVGAIEAHGPHLALSTDVVIARGMARVGAARLVARGHQAILLPALPFTAAPFGGDFVGTLSIRAETVTALVLDLAGELTRHGFAALAIANAHLDPAHLRSLDDAVARAGAAGLLPIASPNLTRRPWAARLTEEFQTGACHAGRFEGSIVLAERPELVREEIAGTLAPNPASLSKAIREGRQTFAEAGGPRAYFGAPSAATVSEGRATLETLGQILEVAGAEALAARGTA
jgi:creatinine amidohydrolase